MPLTKADIEEAIKGKGDFVKINYLNRYLKIVDNIELKKYILLNLAGINESRGMIGDAIKNLSSAAEISITFKEKSDLFMKEAELWIKFGNFDMADNAFKKAWSLGNAREKELCKKQYVELYKMQGKILEDKEKYRNAASVYERLFSMKRPKEEKEVIKVKLMELYEKLGRMRDHDKMKNTSIPEEKDLFGR